ncbi:MULTISPECIES: glycosyltransferase [Nostocales]|nr:glycosyltransferase [Tolypothrix bouteillei]
MPRILYIQYTNPAGYPPLEHSSRILANDGWDVLFLGTGSLGSNSLCFPPHNRITVKQLPFCPGGWRQKLHYLWFCFWILDWAIRWKPQWVYASDLLSCPITLLLSVVLRSKVVYHEHDSLTTAPENALIKLCLKTRRWLAHQAKMCILPNQQRIEQFIKDNEPVGNVFCVWNCPAQAEVSSARLTDDCNHLWIHYHGNIGPSLLPITVLSALAMLPKVVKLRVIGYETIGNQGYVQQLLQTSVDLRISERVEFLGAMPRKKLLEYCRISDVGIAFMPKVSTNLNLQNCTGASNKAFDYLACGLALLVSDLPDWMQMYVEPGYGLSCNPDNPESIATAINWFLQNPNQMRQMGENGRSQILARWNYEQQFMGVYQMMSLSQTK